MPMVGICGDKPSPSSCEATKAGVSKENVCCRQLVQKRSTQEGQREPRRVEGCWLPSGAVSDIKKPMRAFRVAPVQAVMIGKRRPARVSHSRKVKTDRNIRHRTRPATRKRKEVQRAETFEDRERSRWIPVRAPKRQELQGRV